MNISLNVEVLVKDGALVLTNQEGNFITFSSEQSVQRKVSMITMGELCNLPKINVAQTFGFKTRKSYYDIREAVLHGDPAELLPKRTGPQSAPKRTRELEALIIRNRTLLSNITSPACPASPVPFLAGYPAESVLP